ncbi:MAG: hypothetical protein M5U14_00035 [Acidimicrobiia bacterium]|nr:hypothetical protein [Acidimicrobiia bacterium]
MARGPGERLAAALVTVLAAAACSGSDGGGPAADAAPATTAGASTTTAVTACDPARPAPSGRERRTTVHDGIEREYTLSIPASYDGATPAPLLLNLHGFGGTADAQDERTGLPEAGGARGYVVVTPQGLPISIPSGIPGAGDAARFEGIPFWNFFGSGEVDFGGAVLPGGVDPSELGADDVGFLSGLLDELEEELCVDPDRFYSTGMSNGAGMTTTLGCELGERLAAIAPVSGVNLTGRCPGDAPVSVLAVHGDADPAVVYEGAA